MATHVCMKFIYVHFNQDWDRSISPEKVIYVPSTTVAKVLVVREGETGTKETFIFEVQRDHEVWISIHENLIYLPSGPNTRQDGDDVPVLNP